MPDELIDDPFTDTPIDSLAELAATRRTHAGKALQWEVIRSLAVPDDLPLLRTSVPAKRQTLQQIRHNHHLLAQSLAQGKPQAECSLLTGYSPVYISTIRDDPTFQELVLYYSSQVELQFVDVIARLRSLGLSSLDELQARLESDPDSWAKRELMELAELTLIKPMTATHRPLPNQASPVTVSVNFVSPTRKSDPPTIDITPVPDSR